MCDRTCDNCVYACGVRKGPKGMLVCANCPEAPGDLTRVRPKGTCPLFRGKTLGLCGSEVPESGQFSCCDVYPQGLLDDCDRIEAALFERGEDAHEDGLG